MTRKRLAVRFLVANNLPVSVTRVAADTASALARMGVETAVLYPVVDWLEFKQFQISRLPLISRCRWIASLALEFLRNALLRRHWCALRYYQVHPAVRTRRYWTAPPETDSDREVTVVHHPYLIPHLLQQTRGFTSRVIGMVHNNYEQEMRSPWPESAAWKRHCVKLEQSILVPRIATSREGKEAAERLGIRVLEVIPNGIDLNLFRPALEEAPPRASAQRPALEEAPPRASAQRPALEEAPPRASAQRPAESGKKEKPVQVSVFCATNPQKGQAVALEALRGLRDQDPSVRLCSLGNLLPGAEGLFDFHYGFLHGQDYVRALQETDLFVYPSLYDGFPAPPLHAMACGAALVTTAVEGVLGYARDGENCLTCRPGDVEGMRAQIRRLIQDPRLRQEIRSNGLRTVQSFSVDQTARQLYEFLEKMEVVG